MTKWKTARLGDVATLERESVQPERIVAGTLYLGLEHIQSGGEIIAPKPVDAGELASNKFRFDTRHILYGKLRPNLAKIARPDFDGICSTDIVPIAPGPKLDRGYLLHYLRQPEMVAYASSRTAGINLPRLSPSVLEGFRIPLPSLDEQTRIADILDRADALRASRRAALALLDTLPQAIFVEMFGDPRTNPKGWPVPALRELTTIGTGTTPSRADGMNFVGTIPWVKTTEVDGDIITDTEEKISEAAARKCRVFPIGSIIIALYGQGKTRGRCAELGIPAATNQACGVLFPDARYVTSFLTAQLRMAYERLRAMGRGGNQENLNLGLVGSFQVVLPPLALQHEFARRIAAVEALRASQRTSLATLDELFAALQHRAFRGEL